MPAGDPLAYAVAAEQNLEKLATELAKEGVDDATVKGISQMADVLRKVIQALGKGQSATADNAPPEQAGQPPPQNYDQAAGQTQQMMQQSAGGQ